MAKKKKQVRFFGRTLFILYMVLAVYFLFFSDMLDRTMISDKYRYNLEPFAEIKRFWINREQLGLKSIMINIVGNVVCFMPFGFLLPTLSKKKVVKNVVGVFVITLLFTLSIETIQLITKVGAFDVDDILLNTVGGVLGYLVMRMTLHKYTL